MGELQFYTFLHYFHWVSYLQENVMFEFSATKN